ncbi:hypothetical protein [Chryseobacterium sp. FH1]|uniref:hypothetical protein n=1 Tax=Chryseobacterium sp. FH1 TaxID=1233951 RepID=UPI0004E41BA6|nr:hypothetical protein [Chryseobacterium sp. FH1]KFC20529.1 hypothetical protein IO90_15390 [Chryseobacterium sp. FH1]
MLLQNKAKCRCYASQHQTIWLNCQAGTAVINNLINDCEKKSELNQAIVTFDLKAWKEELGSINTEFST